MWKICVVLVVWKSPPNKPRPLATESKNKLSNAKKKLRSKITKTTLLKSKDLSLLNVIEFDNNKNSNEYINIKKNKRIELLFYLKLL